MKKRILINDNPINEESKLIIGIGDSFCAGTGSESFRSWERNNWNVEKMRYDPIAIDEAYENSFINLLTKKYFKDYISVNLGMAGKGNRYAINEIFIQPLLNLEVAKEKIVIFVSSGLERFDFMRNIFSYGNHTTTIWPFYLYGNHKIGYSEIKNEKNESIYDNLFLCSEFITNFLILLNWCEKNNAKLLFISAFTTNINLKYFLDNIPEKIYPKKELEHMSKLLSKIPWHRQVFPMGYECITQMLLHLEGKDDMVSANNFMDFKVDKISEKGFMSKCQHPTKKGQEILCDIFYEQIKNYDNVERPDFEKICLDYLNKYDNKIKRTSLI